MKNKVFTLLLVAFVGGCANFAPEFMRPDAPVAETFLPTDNSQRADEQTQTIELLAWQQFFSDPTLNRLITDALVNNPDVQIAAANVAEVKGLYQIRQSDRQPRFAGSASQSITRSSETVTGSDAIVRQTDLQVGLVSYELDLWGRIGNLRDAALAEYFAQLATQRVVKINVVAETASAYYNWLMAKSIDDLAEKTLANREQSLALIEARYSVGLASQLDVTQAQVAKSAVEAAKASLERQLSSITAQLTQLVGKPIEELLEAAEQPELDATALMVDVPEQLSTEVLYARPDIIRAEQMLKAANARIGAARAAYWPQITLLASGGFASPSLDDLFKASSSTWSFVPRVNLPLFDSQVRANEAISEAQQAKAVAEYQKAVQTAFSEVYTQLLARKALTKELDAQEVLVDAESKRLYLATVRYEAGLASYLPVLEAQQALFDAEQSLLTVKAELLRANVMLYKSLGGADTPSDFELNLETD